MSRIEEVMSKLASKFQPDVAKGLNAVFQIEIEDSDEDTGIYYLSIIDQACEVHHGEHVDPNITLIMDSDTFIDIVDGSLGGTSAYLSGRIRAEGNVMLATQLGKLFKR